MGTTSGGMHGGASGWDLGGGVRRLRPRETARRRQEPGTQGGEKEAEHSGGQGHGRPAGRDRTGRGDLRDRREPEAAVLVGGGVIAPSACPDRGRGSQCHRAPWGSTGVCGSHSASWGVRALSGGSQSPGAGGVSAALGIFADLYASWHQKGVHNYWRGVSVPFRKVRTLRDHDITGGCATEALEVFAEPLSIRPHRGFTALWGYRGVPLRRQIA